jgi:hypothetical protein
MDFIVPDLLSATPTATSDGPVRAARSAPFSGPSARKSFSSVLQGVRGDEKKGSSQEAESPRGFHKVEDRPSLKQNKGLNASTSQTEQSDAAGARPSGSGTVSEGQHETGEGSREERESSLQQSDAGSESEGQALTSTVPTILLQAGVQATTGEALGTQDDRHSSDREEGSAIPSVSARVATDAPLRPTENRSSEKGTAVPSPSVPEQTLDVSKLQKKPESPVKQSAKAEGENDTKAPVTDHARTQPGMLTAPSGGTVASPDLTTPRISQAHEGIRLPEGHSDRNLVIQDRDGDKPVGPTPDKQASLVVPSYGSQEESGTRTPVLTPHGQPSVLDKAEQFGQSGQDRHDRQQGNSETKLFQGTGVDLQAVHGRTAEQYAAVAQGQTTSAPTPSTPNQFVPPVQPAHHVTESAQQPIASLLRSVVVDVAQPDLGHVNIRVAMMNESVHAHFSTDRAEVGQFLINGQDRLQTTLQASGLDMGQFRVDIDRQNGGRSFQQGLFQEQGQSGHHGSQGGAKEQPRGWSDDMHHPLQGRLDVVV